MKVYTLKSRKLPFAITKDQYLFLSRVKSLVELSSIERLSQISDNDFKGMIFVPELIHQHFCNEESSQEFYSSTIKCFDEYFDLMIDELKLPKSFQYGIIHYSGIAESIEYCDYGDGPELLCSYCEFEKDDFETFDEDLPLMFDIAASLIKKHEDRCFTIGDNYYHHIGNINNFCAPVGDRPLTHFIVRNRRRHDYTISPDKFQALEYYDRSLNIYWQKKPFRYIEIKALSDLPIIKYQQYPGYKISYHITNRINVEITLTPDQMRLYLFLLYHYNGLSSAQLLREANKDNYKIDGKLIITTWNKLDYYCKCRYRNAKTEMNKSALQKLISQLNKSIINQLREVALDDEVEDGIRTLEQWGPMLYVCSDGDGRYFINLTNRQIRYDASEAVALLEEIRDEINQKLRENRNNYN